MTTPLPPRFDEEADDLELDTDADGDVSGVLAQRLEELRDARWLTPVVSAALARLTGTAPSVLDCRIEYCKIKPNRDINVAMLVRTLDPAGGEPRSQRLSCTLFPSAEACRRKFAEDDGRNVLHAATRRGLEALGFVESVIVLDEPAMIVRAFPVDPALPGLAHATDMAEMQAFFAKRPEWHGVPPRIRCEVLHYKPRRSCAIHYQLESGGLNGHGAAPRRVYGKLSRDDRGERYHRNLRAAYEAAEASGGLWRAAKPVDYVPSWRLLLQEAVPGRDFRVVFGELTPDTMTSAQEARVTKLLGDIARAVHALQRAPIVEGPVMTFAHLFESQERNLRYMRGTEPRLAAELADVRAETARLEPSTRSNPLVLSHGDFAHGNVLIDTLTGGGDRVGIIDFDKAGAAEPAYDVAYFLTHMWSFGIRHPKRMPHVVRLSRCFREAYLALAPEVSSERLALFEALDFSAYVLRNFRKQSHQGQWLAWARAQVAAARERLEVAGGRDGGRDGAVPT